MQLLWFNLATDIDDPILGFTSAWIREVARRVKSVQVITMRAGRVELPANVRLYSVGKEKGFSKPRRVGEFYCHLFHILRHHPIDGCFSHMIPLFSILAAPVLKTRGIPLVTWYAHPNLTLTLMAAHHLSDRMVASFPKAYPYRPDKLTVIGQGIDTELFSPNGTAGAAPPMILCAGRLSPVKDHPTLLKAAALLRQRWGRPFRVVILGSPAGPRDETHVRSLHEMVREFGLHNVVHFHPGVPAARLPTWYRQATVHVNLTPTGSGDKVALEAMSCGTPCLVANEGFRETLGAYASELLFAFRHPEDLARKIMTLFDLSPPERLKLGAYLRKNVKLFHSLEHLAGRLRSVF